MAGVFRVPVAVIPFEHHDGATVLCDDGSVWELSLGQHGARWSDTKSPLPGSAVACGWSPEQMQKKAGFSFAAADV